MRDKYFNIPKIIQNGSICLQGKEILFSMPGRIGYRSHVSHLDMYSSCLGADAGIELVLFKKNIPLSISLLNNHQLNRRFGCFFADSQAVLTVARLPLGLRVHSENVQKLSALSCCCPPTKFHGCSPRLCLTEVTNVELSKLSVFFYMRVVEQLIPTPTFSYPD